jgi:hypothetical protein
MDEKKPAGKSSDVKTWMDYEPKQTESKVVEPKVADKKVADKSKPVVEPKAVKEVKVPKKSIGFKCSKCGVFYETKPAATLSYMGAVPITHPGACTCGSTEFKEEYDA